MKPDIVARLQKRAEIRRRIPACNSVQLGEPDRIADLLEEAATIIQDQASFIDAVLRELAKHQG